MNPTESSLQQPAKKNFHIPLLVVLMLVLIAAVEFVLLMKKDGKLPTAVSTTMEEVTPAPAEEEAASEGSFKIVADDNNAVHAIGVPFTVALNVDSNGRGVVGFDAVVEYDPAAFILGPVVSNVQGFTAISSTRKNYLEITSSKDPQVATPPVFKDTKVVTITLTPRKAGSYPVRLLDKVDGSSSKFIDINTKIFAPQTSSVTVTVK